MLIVEKVLLSAVVVIIIAVFAVYAAESELQIKNYSPAKSKMDKIPNYTIAFAVTPPAIDGKLDEWKNAAPITLNDQNAAVHYKNWKGPEDFSAKLYMMWDYDALYLAAEVKDTVQMHKFDGEDVWNGDCLQIAFDGFNDRSKDAYNQDDVEMTMALTPKGAQIYCHFAQQKTKMDRLVSGAKINITRSETDKTTRYETAIKWADLEPVMPAFEGALGFTAIFSNANSDGSDIDGWLQWTEGIANSKATAGFGNIFFEKPKYLPKKDILFSGINRVDTKTGEDVINRAVIFSTEPKKFEIKSEVSSKDYKKTAQYITDGKSTISELGIIWSGEKEN